MAQGLNVSGVVRVTVTIGALAAALRNFGAGMVIGSRDVIDTVERKRAYADADGVAQDFGLDAPETKAAILYFSQEPQPDLLYVARWAQTATAGRLNGAVLSAAQQLLSNFTAITSGTLTLTVDGQARALTGLNFSGALNLNGVAQIVQTALVGAGATGATVVWDGVLKRFVVKSGTTGSSSSVSYGTGTVATAMHLTSTDASAPVPGVPAESLVSCVATLADMDSSWYAAFVATATPPSDGDHLAVAQLVEGLGQSHLYGVTVTNSNVLDPTTSADLASQLKVLGLKRTWTQYSSSNPYAVASFFGRAATVDFQGADTTITMMFKREPGVVAETITESQAATLKAKNCNVFVNYNNATAILQWGVMVNGYYFDEVHGTDWFQNELQTEEYNLQYTTGTKIPQTDAGMDLIKAVAKRVCERAVRNGLVAPGQWNGPKIGPLLTGQTLSTGFFIYAPPVATQPVADRAQRKSVSFQIALKLAGAVHDILISVVADR